MMAERIVVVGSGASGVHFALSLLRKGRSVTMLDAGRSGPSVPAPNSTFNALKEDLEDPSAYFLGSRFQGVLLPDIQKEYYGIPPSKEYVFETRSDFGYSSRGFEPLFSFAGGGLGQVWTAGCYPFNEQEVVDFPFPYPDLASQYDEVARRIGITGEEDDLSRFMPVHKHLLPPLKLDAHSQKLMEVYERRRDKVNRKTGAYLGRTRVATLSQALGSRQACDYRGRCLWGCPREALYTPSYTLRECQTYPEFTYVSGMNVEYFKFAGGGRISAVVARPADSGQEEEIAVDRLVLAAGTLMSSKIVMHSVLRETGERIRLPGLMDNRQVLMPFVNLRMIGKQFSAESYQYHLLGLGIQSSDARNYIHGQITTLKTAMLHPVIQNLPFDLRTSTYVTRAMHAALGVVNVNFPDHRRDNSYVTLSGDGKEKPCELTIHYEPAAEEPERIRTGLRKVKQTLRELGCLVPPGMAHVRPMGASVHYAGTLPMTRQGGSFTTTENCQSREFPNLFVVDGSTFPFLPAKNITFTLMANAARVAESAF